MIFPSQLKISTILSKTIGSLDYYEQSQPNKFLVQLSKKLRLTQNSGVYFETERIERTRRPKSAIFFSIVSASKCQKNVGKITLRIRSYAVSLFRPITLGTFTKFNAVKPGMVASKFRESKTIATI